MKRKKKKHINPYSVKVAKYFIWLLLFFSQTVYSQVNQTGDIVELISTIREAIPGSGTNAFVIPSNHELLQFQSVINDLKTGNYSAIQEKLTPYNYEFIRFTDTGSNKVFYIIKEKLPVSKGWGTLISFPNSSDSLSIEAPHPVWDTYSWKLGIKAFTRMNASWFLMAGTHRYANSDSSSDMAHVTQSVFHTAHKTIATPIAIQIHGFNKNNTIYSEYPDIVISNSTLFPPSSFFNLQSQFESQGFTSGVFSYSTYSSLWRLGATTNTQGQWSNQNGKLFVHVEFEYYIRNSTSNTDKAIQAMKNIHGTTTLIRKEENNFNRIESALLHQNFPNPFNNSTTITFDLKEKMNIDLKVFNMIGEVMFSEAEKDYQAGRHSVNINLNGFSSGVYLVQIRNKFFTQTKKITLLK